MRRLVLSVLLGFTVTSLAYAGGTIKWPQPPIPADANPAATPVPPLIGWLNHFQQLLDASHKMEKVDLIFDGDTSAITSGYKGDHGGMWGPRFANLNAFEFSNPGDPTQTVLWRLQNGQVDGLHPKLVILEVGAYNIQTNTPEEIAEGIKADVQEYQKRCPDATILLQGIFPRGELPTEARRVKIKAVNQLIAALGDGKKVIFLDFGDKFLKPDGTMTKEMFVDFAFPRPSPEAFKIWADAIQPVIDQVFPPATTATAPAAKTSDASTELQPPSLTAVGGTVTWPSVVPPGGNSAVIPEPPLGRLNAFQQVLDKAHAMPEVDLIFDGDSITAGWVGGGGGIWNKHYGKLHAVDYGVSGDSTQGLLWRVQNGQVEGLHPKLIVLLIGTNNMGSCTAEQIAGGIKADVEEYQKRCPDAVILLQGILPRGEQPTDPIRAKVKAVNKIISALGDGKKVIFLDWGEKLLTPDGLYTHPITGDFLHPSLPGYQIWADAIQPIVDQVVGLPPAAAPKAAPTKAPMAPPADTTPAPTVAPAALAPEPTAAPSPAPTAVPEIAPTPTKTPTGND